MKRQKCIGSLEFLYTVFVVLYIWLYNMSGKTVLYCSSNSVLLLIEFCPDSRCLLFYSSQNHPNVIASFWLVACPLQEIVGFQISSHKKSHLSLNFLVFSFKIRTKLLAYFCKNFL